MKFFNSDLQISSFVNDIYLLKMLNLLSFLGEINKYIEHKNGNTTNLSEMALSNSRIQTTSTTPVFI